MSTYTYTTLHEGWAELVLNRPDRRNSFIPPLFAEVIDALKQLDDRDDISVILLRGEGGYFCSGIDLKALQQDPPPDWDGAPVSDARSMHLALFRCQTPIIGALESFAINAGAALAFACDLVIGGETAFLQIGEIQQGAGIPMNAAWLKIKTTEFNSARLALIGDRVNVRDLMDLGLVNECVPDNEVVSRCQEIAERIAGFPPGAARQIKRSLINQRGIEDPDSFFPTGGGAALKTAAMVTQ